MNGKNTKNEISTGNVISMESKFARKINNELNTLIRYKSDIFAGEPYEIKSPKVKQKLLLDDKIDSRNLHDF